MDEHPRDCPWCQTTRSAAAKLRYKKLGRHERRQLLAAGPAGGEPSPIIPPEPSHAAQTATRRAIASLQEYGLIEVAGESRRIRETDDPKLLRRLRRKYAVLRLMSRTELGEAIVMEYRSELQRPGQRIRWQTRLAEATDRAILRCPYR